MNVTSITEIERLKNTISKVDQEISRRRTEIKRNMTPNAGIATRELQYMELQNSQRKNFLRVNRGQIEVLYSKSKGYNTMRSSFITPDGPKHKGNRNQPTKSIPQVQKERIIKQPQPQFTPPPSSIKKFTPPPKPISISPPKMLPISKPVSPVLPITKVTDAIRQRTHVIAKEKSMAIRKMADARRDAELVKQGKNQLVATRRNAEMAKVKKAAQYKASVARRAQINDIKTRALNAKKNAELFAQKKSTSIIRKHKPRFATSIFNRGRKGSSGPPNHLVMKFSDKRRSAVINDQIRTNETPATLAMRDQFTEDVRQAPVAPTQTHSKEYYTMLNQLANKKASALKMIQQAYVESDPMATELLGNERVQYWRNRAKSLVGQIEQMAKNELARWDQGMLNAGVAISTDNRSQPTRKMSPQEFESYIEKKTELMVTPLMQEAEQEWMRALRLMHETKRAQQAPKRSRDISIRQHDQRQLLAIDNRRGKGRPVLSEQQGTTGLAGLFPALRNSMQGALK